MKITNNYNLPDAIVEAVQNDSYDRGESDLTVTQLINPPHMERLKWRHADEIEIDVTDRLWALFGQIGHGVLERAKDGAVKEERLYVDINGVKVGGQFDRLLVSGGLLQDYKFTSIYAAMQKPVKSEWVDQMNMLAYICHKNGYEVKKLEIVALLRDHSLRHRMSSEYPDRPVAIIEVPFWSYEATEQYMEERVAEHTQEDPAICSENERWATRPQYAVKKGSNKRALRVLDSFTEAEQYMKAKGGTHIEDRPAENKRCENYCDVAKFCSFWQERYGEETTPKA